MSTIEMDKTAPRQGDVGDAPAEGKITAEAIGRREHDRPAAAPRRALPAGRDRATRSATSATASATSTRSTATSSTAACTRYGTMLAHPMFPMAFGWVGRTRWGLPGVHGFYAGNDWELFRHVRPGDRITAIERVVGVEEKESKFSGRLVLQYVEATYCNQRGELVARALGTCTRHERKAARDAGKYKDIKTARVHAPRSSSASTRRSSTRRRTSAAPTSATGKTSRKARSCRRSSRGPLSLMDTMGFLVGCGRGHTHGVDAARTP